MQYVCPLCLDLGWVSHEVPVGHPDFGKVFPCECRAGAVSVRMQAISGLIGDETTVNLADIVRRGAASAKAVRWASLLVGNRAGFLTIWGGPGNGKTMVLQAVVNTFIQHGQPAVYVTFADLADWVREAFGGSCRESAHARIERIASVPCLAIDEVDKPKDSDWMEEFRSRVFDRRYREALAGKSATLFAMNKSPENLFDTEMWLTSRLGDGRFAFEYALGKPVPAIIENREPDIRPLLSRAGQAH